MDEPQESLDLELWLDAKLIRRQNLLKSQFIDLLKLVGNSLPMEQFKVLSTKSKGSKISRGNDLHGLPYQVLDLIRDFDLNEGVNIRLLNWFGIGFFITVLLGKNRPNPVSALLELGFAYGLSENQWDYPDLILSKNQIDNPEKIREAELGSHHWIKALPVAPDVETNAQRFVEEVKKTFAILKRPNQ